MGSALCGDGFEWVRLMHRCPACKTKRRMLMRLVFSGYGSDAVCGGCGTWWSDGERLRNSAAALECNRYYVRENWPTALPRAEWRKLMGKMLDETMTQTEKGREGR